MSMNFYDNAYASPAGNIVECPLACSNLGCGSRMVHSMNGSIDTAMVDKGGMRLCLGGLLQHYDTCIGEPSHVNPVVLVTSSFN